MYHLRSTQGFTLGGTLGETLGNAGFACTLGDTLGADLGNDPPWVEPWVIPRVKPGCSYPNSGMVQIIAYTRVFNSGKWHVGDAKNTYVFIALFQ